MTVVYIDTLFLLNTLMDYLLLLASARLAGEQLCRGRMLLASVMGGAYAVTVFLPGMEFLLHPTCKIGAAVLMVVIGLGGSRRLTRQILIFFALACAFGGGILAIELLGGQGVGLYHGFVTSNMDLKVILLSAAGCYAVVTLVFRRVGRHTALSGELVPLQLTLQGRRVSLMALTDTGNTLTDPISGQGVVVAEGDSLIRLFPEGTAPVKAELSAPADALHRLNTGPLRGRFRLLPYRAVGVECGLLLAVRADRVTVGGKDRGSMLVALSPTPVSDGGGYRALIGT